MLGVDVAAVISPPKLLCSERKLVGFISVCSGQNIYFGNPQLSKSLPYLLTSFFLAANKRATSLPLFSPPPAALSIAYVYNICFLPTYCQFFPNMLCHQPSVQYCVVTAWLPDPEISDLSGEKILLILGCVWGFWFNWRDLFSAKKFPLDSEISWLIKWQMAASVINGSVCIWKANQFRFPVAESQDNGSIKIYAMLVV